MTATATTAGPPLYDRWETFDVRDGLPSNKVFCVYPTGDAVWAGTDRGLARYQEGRWQTFSRDDGMPHPAVLSIAQDRRTEDLWLATMGGLGRYSAGRVDTFNQFNSGLANDVVYAVAVHDGAVWAATAAGASRYDIARDSWTIFNETNTPMHEVWCYSVTYCANRIYLGVWGGGLLEFDLTRGRWKDYRDPDGEMEIDLFRDDGLVHDVIASVSCDEKERVWIGTYFGLSSYDGRRWRNYLDHDSPLTSNFINFVAANGNYAWIATDDGLCATDRDDWWVYRRDVKSERGAVTHFAPDGKKATFTTDTIFPHNYILGIGFSGKDLWVATEKGVARGCATMEDQAANSPSTETSAEDICGRGAKTPAVSATAHNGD